MGYPVWSFNCGTLVDMKNSLSNNLKFLFLTLTFLALFTPKFAHGGSQASATALATMEVLPSITLAKTQDLSFGSSAPGDGPKELSPSGCTGCAQFQVSGGPNAAYSIELPPDGTVALTNGQGNSIPVTQFRSLPASTGTLSNAGSQQLTIGATRGAVAPSAATGLYSGSFTVTVCYQ